MTGNTQQDGEEPRYNTSLSLTRHCDKFKLYNYRILYLLFDFLVFLNIFPYSHDFRRTSWTPRLSPVLPGTAWHCPALPGITWHCPEVLFTIADSPEIPSKAGASEGLVTIIILIKRLYVYSFFSFYTNYC